MKPGENAGCLCTKVFGRNIYLEGQDYWRLAGIFDDVWLYATPAVRIFDWQVITEFDNTYTDSQLSIQVKIKDYQKKPNENYGLKAYLKDKNGKIICNFSAAPFEMDAAEKVYSCIPWYKNLKWTAETPELYTLGLELSNPGRSTERQDRNGHRIQKDGKSKTVFFILTVSH